MSRNPKPYKKGNYYCTSFGGRVHHKLCRIDEGLKLANTMLMRLILKHEDEPKVARRATVPAVAEVIDAWLTWLETHKSAGTYNFYRLNIIPLRERVGDIPIKELTDEHATEYMAYLKSQFPSKHTINMRIQAATVFMRWACKPIRAARYFYIANPTNPFAEMKPVRADGRNRTLSDDEFNAVMKSLTRTSKHIRVEGRDLDHEEIFGVMRGTTMRPQELRQLKWEYIDWTNHQINYPAEVIKIRRERTVTMIDSVEALLRRRAERLKSFGNNVESGYVFFPPTKKGNGWTTNISNGKMLSTEHLHRKWAKAVRECIKEGRLVLKNGESPPPPYVLRHTRITELGLSKIPFKTIMNEAGHTEAKTTIRYMHTKDVDTELVRGVDQEKKRNALEQERINQAKIESASACYIGFVVGGMTTEEAEEKIRAMSETMGWNNAQLESGIHVGRSKIKPTA